jgi:peroxiredoxin (alkyl hydroperoxide reductase subunit C)
MGKETDSCVQPAGGPVVEEAGTQKREIVGKEQGMGTTARVGEKAPDFEASAYIAGEGFKNVKLSDYRGQWVLLCFYPGDFTFV